MNKNKREWYKKVCVKYCKYELDCDPASRPKSNSTCLLQKFFMSKIIDAEKTVIENLIYKLEETANYTRIFPNGVDIRSWGYGYEEAISEVKKSKEELCIKQTKKQ